MRKPNHSIPEWCGVVWFLMLIIGGITGLLAIFNTGTSNFWDLVCIFHFVGAGVITVCCIIRGSGSPYANEALNTSLARDIADTYVLAWKHYQEYEANIRKAWLFQNTCFMKNIQRTCVERVLSDRYDHNYEGCRFYVPDLKNQGHDILWRLSIQRQEILSHPSVQAIMDNIPDLTAAFDYDLASKATDTELIQSAIPSHDDPRTTTMHMPVWSEDDQAWHVQEIKREGVV